ncbi:MAG: hypothetical protein US57_C0010G0010 [Candidatus Moranbacteria bacterium GW2011_GWC2_37_73]|nr:MAG: hypothetical protein UR95_C0008G0022 [Parcubacteria group bacterium GW2011_GWC1_36_108]KKQ00765.1 MAG: hypothetical protein US09_C0006G0010 [Candidatus Moranbacteria bacterium GW2011_GWD1_36_198]KKQ02226.1 MAG: hypothetical protein US10_C0005G0006 [Candidatus Moranbacteria bacterium GW2011_GWD2_36_198]KKQ39691.1 MAG: hypothetical protein US57_C0010G0010 [Candidatus Moranbacteria bacterium GW2011_GWC2_37_73]HAR99643.1 hypothetical protein [Candidatus Moranbacteria bacterium]
MEKKYNKIKRGFSLVEVLISLLVLSIGISSVLFLMTANTKNSINAKNQIIASELAQEGIELVRNLKDNGEATLDALNALGSPYNDKRIDYTSSALNMGVGTDKRLYLNGGFYTHTNGAGSVPTKFYRTIYLTVTGTKALSTREIEVTSYVTWKNNGFASITGFPGTCNIANNCVSVKAVFPDL